MLIAGPVSTQEEAQALEQASYLLDLRARLAAGTPLPRMRSSWRDRAPEGLPAPERPQDKQRLDPP